MPPAPDNISFPRRRFVAGGLAAGVAALAACGRDNTSPALPANNAPGQPRARAFQRGKLGSVIGGAARPDDSGSMQHYIGVVDLDESRVRVVSDVGFLGHGFAPNPVKPRTFVVSQKHGPGCCELDLAVGRVTRRITTVPGREFYGHGAFSPDGKTFYAAEAITGDYSKAGVLAVRDGESFELKPEQFPTHGVAPHDCILVDDGETLVVTNGGGPLERDDQLPSVAYVNVRSGEARKVLRFKDRSINAGHIAITSRGELVCVSAPREGIPELRDGAPNPAWIGAISFYDPARDEVVTPQDPIRRKMRGETLSVAIHEPSMIVAATNPKGHIVTFWDFHSGKLVHHIEGTFKDPRGISLTQDGNYFALTYDQHTHLILLDAQTFKPVEESKVETSYISGSHNISYNL